MYEGMKYATMAIELRLYAKRSSRQVGIYSLVTFSGSAEASAVARWAAGG